MRHLFVEFFNVIIKSEFIVYSNTQNSFFFAIFEDSTIKRKICLFSFATQALPEFSNIRFSGKQVVTNLKSNFNFSFTLFIVLP